MISRRGAITVAPILPVHDMDRAIRTYEHLGFSIVHRYETYALLSREEVDIHLSHVEKFDPAHNTSAVYLYVDDVAAEYHRATGIRSRYLTAPRDEPWGVREFQVIDEDGNLWRVGEVK